MQILNVRKIRSIDIDDGAVTTAKLDDTAVTTNKISDDAVTTSKINDSAVTTVKINNNAVTSTKLATASVTNPKLDDGVVDITKLFRPEAPSLNSGDVVAGYSPTVQTESSEGVYRAYGPLFLLPAGGRLRFSFQGRRVSPSSVADINFRLRGYGPGHIVRTIATTSTNSTSWTDLVLTPLKINESEPGELVWLEFARAGGPLGEIRNLVCFRTTATSNSHLNLLGIFTDESVANITTSGPIGKLP